MPQKKMFLVTLAGSSELGRVHRLSEDFSIGRDSGSQVVIPHDSVSRKHALVTREGKSFILSDAGSRNGTLLNKKKVTRTELSHGDLIRIGPILLFCCETIPSNESRELDSCFDTSRDMKTALGGETMSSSLMDISPLALERACNLVRSSLHYQGKTRAPEMSQVIEEVFGKYYPKKVIAIWKRLAGDALEYHISADSSHGSPAVAHSDFSLALASLALETRKPLVCNQIERWSDLALLDSWIDGSHLLVPVSAESEDFVISILDAEGTRCFTPTDSHLAQIIGLQLFAYHSMANEVLRLETNNSLLAKSLEDQSKILGESDSTRKLRDEISTVAPTDSSILILGESGVGKELVARSIHTQSNRNRNAFVAINCAALPDALLESALFGHEKGAFTGADSQKIGHFELADGGTLFLDEVGEMSLSCQAKLLRVLELGEFLRVGGVKPLRTDVRILAATNRDMPKLIEEGNFREDLYYRICVAPLHVPALRHRGNDKLLLAEWFLGVLQTKMGKNGIVLGKSAKDAIMSYNYPGNVRELKNCIERALVFCKGQEVQADILSLQPNTQPISDEKDCLLSLKEMEEKHVRKVLQSCDGNKSKAAKQLGISRAALYAKMESYV